jgi:hypothetical protein
MCSRQSSDAVQSSIPHLTIVNVPIKWWSDLPFKAGVPPFYGNTVMQGKKYLSDKESVPGKSVTKCNHSHDALHIVRGISIAVLFYSNFFESNI